MKTAQMAVPNVSLQQLVLCALQDSLPSKLLLNKAVTSMPFWVWLVLEVNLWFVWLVNLHVPHAEILQPPA